MNVEEVRITPGEYEADMYIAHKDAYYTAPLRVLSDGTAEVQRPDGEWTPQNRYEQLIRARLQRRY